LPDACQIAVISRRTLWPSMPVVASRRSNAAIYSTALDITDAANALAAEGHPVNTDDLATFTPYITRAIRRFGDWVLDLKPPDWIRWRGTVWWRAPSVRASDRRGAPCG
jgi:hypothetical protein